MYMEDLSILVIEPSLTQRNFLLKLLEGMGVRDVLSAVDVESAIARMNSDMPDIVISAFYLPDMSSDNALEYIRARSPRPDTAFILVTSEGNARYLERIKQAGVSAILEKPYSGEALQQAIVSIVNGLNEAAWNAVADAEYLNVLVVDDSAVAKQYLGATLKKFGFEKLTYADDGSQALALCAGQAYDLIITDCHMPIMSGIEFIGQLRSDCDINGATPVILLTTDDLVRTEEAAMAAGASAVCLKPYTIAALNDAIAEVLAV